MARRTAVLVTVAVACFLAAGGVLTTSAGSSGASSFVPVAPCRLMDTRRAPDTVGPRASAIGAGETYVAAVWGTNGKCTIPATATAVAMNVTIIGPTSSSFLTVFGGGERPLASSLNWVAGQAPTGNAVTSPLSSDGTLSWFNLSGSVDVVADVVGFYEAASAGPPGPKGDTGSQGPKGDTGLPGTNGTNGVTPARVVWVAASGGDFTTVGGALSSITTAGQTQPFVIRVAPGRYTESTPLTAKDYVDIEGSGQASTTLTCACGSATGPATDASSATVRIGNVHTELRNLTVVNSGGGAHAVGIRVGGAAAGSVSLRDVTATATGTSDGYGVFAEAASVTMSGVTASGSGPDIAAGVYNDASSSAKMSNVVATASTSTNSVGVFNIGNSTVVLTEVTATGANYGVLDLNSSTLVIRNSVITGTDHSVQTGSSSTAKIANTTLGGGVVVGTGFVCTGAYDANFVALNTSCT